MKKISLILLMAMIMMTSATAVSAKADAAKGKGKVNGAVTTEQTVTDEQTTEEETTEDSEADEEATEEEGAEDQGNGGKGLQNAYNHVKNPKAKAVLANLLLTKYDITVTSDVYGEEAGDTSTEEAPIVEEASAEELELAAEELKETVKSQKLKKKDKAKAFADLAELYLAAELTEDAVAFQEEAIAEDVANLQAYKNLGQMKKALGMTGVGLYVNGKEPVMDVRPFIKEGRTLVPVRAITEALNADITWDAETRTVTIVRDDVTVVLTLGSNIALVNGEEVVLDVTANSIEGRTMVPARFVSTALQAIVEWEPTTSTVVIYDEEVAAEEEVEEETVTEEEASTEEEATTEETTTEETTTEEAAAE